MFNDCLRAIWGDKIIIELCSQLIEAIEITKKCHVSNKNLDYLPNIQDPTEIQSFAHMQILYNQQKQKGEQKIKTTRAEATAKKVNNMPNLQSMSQAKGYGRLSKKSSQNSPVSVKSPVNPTSPSLISTLLASDKVENPC